MRTQFFLYAPVISIALAFGFIVSGGAYAAQAIDIQLAMQRVSPVSDASSIVLVHDRRHGRHHGWRHGTRVYPNFYQYYGGGYYYAPYSASFCPNPLKWDRSLGQWVCTP